MARRSSLRASDADRERVTDLLRQAAVEGRLVTHELEERLATALRARTYGELDAVVADLPTEVAPSMGRTARSVSLARSHPGATVIVMAGIALALVVVAAVALATLFASGVIWLILALVFLGRRGPWSGGGYGRYGRGRYRRGSI